MAEIGVNEFLATLAGSLNDNETEITLSEAPPAAAALGTWRMRIGPLPTSAELEPDFELVIVDGTLTVGAVVTVTRGAEGTTAVAWSDETPVSSTQTAGSLAAMIAEAGGAGVLQSVTVDLTTNDIATLSSVPIDVVPAPGAGKVIVPVQASFQYKAGTVGFARNAELGLILPDLDTNGLILVGPMQFAGTTASIGFGIPVETYVAQSAGEDAALSLQALTEPQHAGPIVGASVSSGGSGYAPGDFGWLELSSEDAQYEVDTVDGGGAVLTFHLTFPGTQYGLFSDNTTVIGSGGGDAGFHVNIDSIDPQSDGTGRLTVLYYVMDLL